MINIILSSILRPHLRRETSGRLGVWQRSDDRRSSLVSEDDYPKSVMHRKHFRKICTAAVDKDDKAAIASARRELRYWAARRASAQVIEPLTDKNRVHFGATVTVRRDDDGTQTFRIVGEDEAEPARGGTLSHISPLASAVLGKSVGEFVTILGREAEILEIK